MKSNLKPALAAAMMLILAFSCQTLDDLPSVRPDGQEETNRQKVDFEIQVTREGQPVEPGRQGVMTRGAHVDSHSNTATMNTDLPFGLVAIDPDQKSLVIDNARVDSDMGVYGGYFDTYFWDQHEKLQLSAYYPQVSEITYGQDYVSYSIPYSVEDTEAGPLVSQTVERAIHQMNLVPLVFQHITNDIGYKICDVTPDPQLQGLIHLRKLVATNVASVGVFINDLSSNTSTWYRQGYYRDIVVFEGDALVGVGSENERFVGYDTLEETMRDSHRYYSIPDEILMGKQCVDVTFDVDGFTLGGYYYEPLKDQQCKYMLYGLLPDNEFVYGRQYTFHIGLDLSDIYHEISFTASVAGWETKIYENNDTF